MLAPSLAHAALGDRPEDRVTLTHVDNRLIAVTAAGFAAVLTQLELGEAIIDLRARGNVGVAVTSRRLLAIQARAANFTEVRYRVSERPPVDGDLLVRDRLVVAAFPSRTSLLAADRRLAAVRPGPGEKPIDMIGEENVAVVVTPRRAVAFSPLSSGFVAYR